MFNKPLHFLDVNIDLPSLHDSVRFDDHPLSTVRCLVCKTTAGIYQTHQRW